MNENGKMTYFGGTDAWAMNNAKSISDLERDAAVKMHNDAIDVRTAALNAKIKDDIEKAKEVTEKMQSMEIAPLNQYILVKPYSTNPYQKIEVSDSGLVIPTYDGSFKNPDTGEDDTLDNFSRQGTVIEVGPLVKWVKVGDDIFYRKGQAVPIPFFKMGMEVVPENNVQCVINENVTSRWKNNE